tara:strand:+ start:317 stop:943 length:627 start_codon:yes stop_codon:yes gene_type:complete
MNDLYIQFLSIATIHLFAVMSPGPDFTIILKQSVSHGRKASMVTSLGIGVGILFHIFFCIIGLGLVISRSSMLFNIIKVLGALYLGFIGIKSILGDKKINEPYEGRRKNQKLLNSFTLGLLTNILNPKATLFFLSLYAMIITSETSISIQVAYGIWMSLITGLWFCLLSIFLTNSFIGNRINSFSHVIQIGTGGVLIFFAIKLLLSYQ